jgi:hypothetical protein
MEISKQLKCIVLRNGIEIWAESERMQTLIGALRTIKESKFIEYDGQVINTADITGIFSPDTMDDYRRRKNGQWQCSHGAWHDKSEKCECKMGMSSSDKIRYMYGN